MRILHDKINSIQEARQLYRLMRPILVTRACSRCDEQVVTLLTKKKKKTKNSKPPTKHEYNLYSEFGYFI